MKTTVFYTNPIPLIMKTRVAFLMFFFLKTVLFLSAQTTWQGGFPGHETDWMCARNWDTGRVPEEFDDVLIPDCSTRGNFYPVIKTRVATIHKLELDSQAQLRITAKGYLTIQGLDERGNCLVNFSTIQNDGVLEVIEQELGPIAYAGDGVLIHRQGSGHLQFGE